MQRRNRQARGRPTRNALHQVEQRQLNQLVDLNRRQESQIRAFMERVPDVPRIVMKRDKVYTFCRASTSTTLLNSQVTPVGYSFAPSLNDLPNSSEFVNLFEQYRIIQITWLFVPLFTGLANPLYTWFDPDDDATPTGLAEGRQNQTLRISQVGQFVERTFTAQTSQDGIATGGAISGYSAPSSSVWMDTASLTNKYYGIKAVFAANSNVGAAVPMYSVECSVIVQCRRPQ